MRLVDAAGSIGRAARGVQRRDDAPRRRADDPGLVPERVGPDGGRDREPRARAGARYAELLAAAPACPTRPWKLELADAGHWSVSDLAGLVTSFAPGCGDAARQTDGEPLSYLDPEVGREIVASHLTAFFRANLDEDSGSRAYLGREFPDAIVDVEHHH